MSPDQKPRPEPAPTRAKIEVVLKDVIATQHSKLKETR